MVRQAHHERSRENKETGVSPQVILSPRPSRGRDRGLGSRGGGLAGAHAVSRKHDAPGRKRANLLTRIHHIGIVVRSAEDALAFYRDVLRLPVTKDAVLHEQGVRGVLLAAGDSELELLEPVRPDTGVARFLESHGEGLHHLCFASSNINEDLTAARAQGLELIDERPRPGLAGMIAFLHPRATRGVLVEYAQPPQTNGSRSASGGAVGSRGGGGTTAYSLLPTAPFRAGDGAAPTFDHVAVAASDVEATVAIFRANFGFEARGPVNLPALGVRSVAIPVGNAFVEIMMPLTGDGPVAGFLKERNEALYLVALAVADLDEAIADLADRGLRASEPVEAGGARISFLSRSAAHGVLIQLTERRVPSHSVATRDSVA